MVMYNDQQQYIINNRLREKRGLQCQMRKHSINSLISLLDAVADAVASSAK